MRDRTFVIDALAAGGIIKPLILPSSDTNGTAIFNPSVFIDGDKTLVNIRHCQYTLYHSEKKKYEHEFGPLLYLNPEDDITLTTTNYLCELNDDLTIANYSKVDTSAHDVAPLWEFIGLEDARVVRWDNKLYFTGVRRDTTPHGQGRMELSEIVDNAEVSRFRIPAPGNNDSYCEKNWMPIIDQPYHYVKWCNPTEVVKVDPDTKTCETVFLGNYTPIDYDLRGGSHVIPFKDKYICLVHTVRLFRSQADRKDAIYRHAFVVWDKEFNFIGTTEEFSFMGADIEFCCGMAQKGDDMLITFGFQDNAAFILKVPTSFIEETINAIR